MKASRLFDALSAVSLVMTILVMTVLTFANPDMTRTRLFLTFWPVLLVGTLLAFGFFIASVVVEPREESMSPLDAAKALAETEPIGMNRFEEEFCNYCPGGPGDHGSDCPWLALPAIVKALEDGEALREALSERVRITGEVMA